MPKFQKNTPWLAPKIGAGVLEDGTEISDDVWFEFGILSIDSASGSGAEDQRLGSTGYLVGLSVGF